MAQTKAKQTPDNMEIWSEFATTDPKYTQSFDRRSYRGTTINKQWLWLRLTERFGPNGIGWGTEHDTMFKEMPNGDMLVIFRVVIWYYSEPSKIGSSEVAHRTTPGWGSDYMFRSNKGKTDDDAMKKAFSDALGNAAKYLGLGADVYLGLYDDDKYVESLTPGEGSDPNEPSQRPIRDPLPGSDPENRRAVLEMMEASEDPGEEVFQVQEDGTVRFNLQTETRIGSLVWNLMANMPSIDPLIEFAHANKGVAQMLSEKSQDDAFYDGAFAWCSKRLRSMDPLDADHIQKAWGKISRKVNATKNTLPFIFGGVTDAFKEVREEIENAD